MKTVNSSTETEIGLISVEIFGANSIADFGAGKKCVEIVQVWVSVSVPVHSR